VIGLSSGIGTGEVKDYVTFFGKCGDVRFESESLDENRVK